MKVSADHPFEKTYLGQLRKHVGSRLLMVPGIRAVLLNERGEVLLQRRRDFGIWGIPGGSAEERESIEDCLRREVKEETGLEALEYRPVGFSSNPALEVFTYPNGHVIHSYSLIFQVTRWSGKLDESNEESLELRYFSRDALPEMLPNEKESLARFFAFQATGVFQFS